MDVGVFPHAPFYFCRLLSSSKSLHGCKAFGMDAHSIKRLRPPAWNGYSVVVE